MQTPNKPASLPPQAPASAPRDAFRPLPAAIEKWVPDTPAKQHLLALLLTIVVPMLVRMITTTPSPGTGLLAFALIALGFASATAGLALYGWWLYAAWQHREDESWAPPWRLGFGPTSFSRHPGWLAVVAVVVGQLLIAPSIGFGIYALLVVIGLNVLVRRVDEPLLVNAYGTDYEPYRILVPRWLPWRGVVQSLRDVGAMLRDTMRSR